MASSNRGFIRLQFSDSLPRASELLNMDAKVVTMQPGVFQSQMLDPPSQLTYNDLTRKHMSGPAVVGKVHEAGLQLTQGIHGKFVSMKENMSYSQLVSGLVYEGESILTHDPHLAFLHVTVEEEGKTPVTKPGGIAMITNRRLLLLSAQYFQTFSLAATGDPKKLPGGYVIETSCRDSTYYFPIPLHLLRSIELEGKTGVSGSISIFGEAPPCMGLLGCCGVLGMRYVVIKDRIPSLEYARLQFECLKSWRPSPMIYNEFNETVLKLGVLLPPWQTRTFIKISINPQTPLHFIRDVMSLIQTYATNLL